MRTPKRVGANFECMNCGIEFDRHKFSYNCPDCKYDNRYDLHPSEFEKSDDKPGIGGETFTINVDALDFAGRRNQEVQDLIRAMNQTSIVTGTPVYNADAFWHRPANWEIIDMPSSNTITPFIPAGNYHIGIDPINPNIEDHSAVIVGTRSELDPDNSYQLQQYLYREMQQEPQAQNPEGQDPSNQG